MIFNCPRIVISALKGGSGKTLVSVGLSSLFKEKGYRVAPFKKGPDFIDPGWLSFASGRKCFNLDQFLMKKTDILDSFIENSSDADIAIIEGNRGLYDGVDREGRYSTAELAKLLKSPVILIVDVTMMTRTVSALVKGCQIFDRAVNISAVILNRVAGQRQEKIIRNTVEYYCGIPVIGSIPKLKENLLKERHMGLVPYQEKERAEEVIYWAKSIIKETVDTDVLEEIAKSAPPIERGLRRSEEKNLSNSLKIGFFLDNAFWFYYPENLELLKKAGVQLIRINSLEDNSIPDVDALYIGGGFPETQADLLARNISLKEDLKRKIEEGLPVYAECGGFMYLGKEIITDGKKYPMVGIFSVKFLLEKKPQGHGYTVLEVCRENPFFEKGEIIKGHEFHYSRPILEGKEEFVFKVKRGKGIDGGKDGMIKRNVLATYTHIHARGNKRWVNSIIKAAAKRC